MYFPSPGPGEQGANSCVGEKVEGLGWTAGQGPKIRMEWVPSRCGRAGRAARRPDPLTLHRSSL